VLFPDNLSLNGRETPIDDALVPLLGPKASLHPEFTWTYTLEPNPNTNGGEQPYPRGKAIGGTSLVNFM
jgi:choline dehydrogenase-like flavoprotein